MKDLMKSVTFREIIEKGREEGMEKGRKEGREEGREEGLRKSILKILLARFGKLPEGLSKKLEKIHEETKLESLIDKEAVIKTIEEFSVEL